MKISQARGAAWAKAQGWESPRNMEDPLQLEVGYPEKDAGTSDWKALESRAEDLTHVAVGNQGGMCAGADVVQRMKQEQVEVARMQGEPGWEAGWGVEEQPQLPSQELIGGTGRCKGSC